MFIHVVQPGDSLWKISNRYGVSTQEISDINELSQFPYLVVGQALVIPSRERSYTVRPGDSLWSISRRFNIPVNSIASANSLTPQSVLTPGQVIKIPARAKNFGYIETNAFIEPSTAQTETEQINKVGQYLTYISPFSYQVNADGSLNSIKDDNIISSAKRFRAAPMMVITNFTEGNFSTELGRTILTTDSVQQNLISNVLSTMRSKGYYGIVVDFERLPVELRESYNNFLRKFVTALHKENFVVATALAPKTSATQAGAWYEAHDYRAHGEIVDFVIIMTYEWGWSGGPPLPVAPIGNVRAVLNYAVSVMPAKKIMMGMPLYGYDWTLPYVPNGPFAKRVSPQDAIATAARYNREIGFDHRSQSPFINYVDSVGKSHIIWFEDARSVRAKFLLASEMGLRGVSYWELGPEFPQNWVILDDMFNIVKVIK